MRVTIFHSHFTAMGGAEVLLTAQARWLEGAGHDVSIVSLHTIGPQCAVQLQGLRTDTIGLPRGARKIDALTSAMMPELIERARPFLRDVDVVMAYNYPTAPIAAAAAECRRVWYACEPYRAIYLREANPAAAAHAGAAGGLAADFATQQVARRLRRRKLLDTVLPWAASRQQALKTFDSEGVRALDGVASLSKYGAICVAEATGRTDARVVYPMVQFSDLNPLQRGLRRAAPQIMVQTRLGVPKNIDSLIRALAIVRKIHARADLHVVGSGTRLRALQQLADRIAPGAVHFHGYLRGADVDALAARCDIFAFAPVDEPFGMVFPEAASRGLLLVGSDHGGPREILEDGVIGELCDPFSPESIAGALKRTLALSDAEADARRNAANASVRARFAPDTVGRQLEAFLAG
jgi:glycosyltransferase involved in cell wall biosynthesis